MSYFKFTSRLKFCGGAVLLLAAFSLLNGCRGDLSPVQSSGGSTTAFLDPSGNRLPSKMIHTNGGDVDPQIGFSCPTGYTLCGAVCVNLKDNANDCGACGKACPVPSNGAAVCSSGVC